MLAIQAVLALIVVYAYNALTQSNTDYFRVYTFSVFFAIIVEFLRAKSGKESHEH